MGSALTPAHARRLWHVAEAVHAVVYFAPETARAATDVGLKGFWMGYFAGRAAPMGAVGPAVVTATFFNFHPAMVRRAIPDAWAFAAPETVLAARLDAVTAALGRLLDGVPGVEEAADLARDAVESSAVDGRPLAAAWAAVPPAGQPLRDLWRACTVLREHRGDGHVAALVDAELDGCQAHALAAAGGVTPRQALQPHRGWSDEEWHQAEQALRERGWLDVRGALTEAGRAARARVETRTDTLALPPLRHLGAARAERLIALLEPMATAVRDAEAIPFPNPMGLPRPGAS